MDKLKKLNQKIMKCTKCELSKDRTNAVPGEGDPSGRIMFIGEAPGKKEDLQGRPFVGRAGSVLDEILAEVGIKREKIFIANIIKCRPPRNRVPKKPEIEACRRYLMEQIEIIRPELIIALGRSAFTTLTGLKGKMRDFHGKMYQFMDYPLLVTYHPAAIVYNRKLRVEMVADLRKI
jgi:DNA polymerase